jgi:protein AaeX
MRYAEINLLGVYVAPIAPMIVLTWLLVLPVRRVAEHFGMLRFVWHPALFVFAVYAIVLSTIVLLTGRIAG